MILWKKPKVYEILNGGPAGPAIRYAKVGDSVYHKWTCVSEMGDIYCMRVHTCTVNDGQGGDAVEVIDKKGLALARHWSIYIRCSISFTCNT
ncbi:unnamed protein product [Gongylonema pulchrum]|uniref:ZP domain-containing protein n=1 Tax=Gongylonema pulchrum TaxID=637853 RepID=A0A183E6B9_9BILA|nr:unnamed protein product [Gongylonema pulchrum]